MNLLRWLGAVIPGDSTSRAGEQRAQATRVCAPSQGLAEHDQPSARGQAHAAMEARAGLGRSAGAQGAGGAGLRASAGDRQQPAGGAAVARALAPIFALTLALLVVSGCERSPDPEAHAPGDQPAPAYNASVDVVQDAVVRAIDRQLGMPKLDDRAKHRVEYDDGGDAVAADIALNADGLMQVSMTVRAWRGSNSLWLLQKLSSRISIEMSRVGVKP